MFAKYRKSSDTAAVVAILSAFAAAAVQYFRDDPTVENLSSLSSIQSVLTSTFLILVCVALASLLAALYAYLQAKGRSVLWLVILPVGVIGLAIFLSLEDRSNYSPGLRCPKCSCINLGCDPKCSYCKSSLVEDS